MSLKPMGALLLTKAVKIEDKAVNGIIMPYKEEKDFKIVEVLDIGAVEQPFRYHVGQQLIVSKYAGRNIEHEGQQYVLIDEKEVYAEIVE